MTCDDVFDLLTGQRRPESRESQELMKRHLAGCRSCRRLADALEPAVELFRQCAADDFTSPASLDGPWSNEWEEQEASEFQSGSYRNASRSSHVPQPHSARSGQRLQAWLARLGTTDVPRLAAALLIGLTLGAMLWASADKDSVSAAANAPLVMSAAPGSAPSMTAPPLTLAEIRLTAACLPAGLRQAGTEPGPAVRLAVDWLAASQLDSLDCCTLCHAQGMAWAGKSATAEVARSCQVCHTF